MARQRSRVWAAHGLAIPRRSHWRPRTPMGKRAEDPKRHGVDENTRSSAAGRASGTRRSARGRPLRTRRPRRGPRDAARLPEWGAEARGAGAGRARDVTPRHAGREARCPRAQHRPPHRALSPHDAAAPPAEPRRPSAGEARHESPTEWKAAGRQKGTHADTRHDEPQYPC